MYIIGMEEEKLKEKPNKRSNIKSLEEDEIIEIKTLRDELNKLCKYIKFRIKEYKDYDERFLFFEKNYNSIQSTFKEQSEDYETYKDSNLYLYGPLTMIMTRAIKALNDLKVKIEEIEKEGKARKDVINIVSRINNYDGASINELLSLIEKLPVEEKEYLIVSEDFLFWLCDWFINKNSKEKNEILIKTPKQLKEKIFSLLPLRIKKYMKEAPLKSKGRELTPLDENIIEILLIFDGLSKEEKSFFVFDEEFYSILYTYIFNNEYYDSRSEEIYKKIPIDFKKNLSRVIEKKMNEYFKEASPFVVPSYINNGKIQDCIEHNSSGAFNLSSIHFVFAIEKYFYYRSEAVESINKFLEEFKENTNINASEMSILYEEVFQATFFRTNACGPLPRVEDEQFNNLFNSLKERILEIIKVKTEEYLKEVPLLYTYMEHNIKEKRDYSTLSRQHEESNLENDKLVCKSLNNLIKIEQWFSLRKEAKEKIGSYITKIRENDKSINISEMASLFVAMDEQSEAELLNDNDIKTKYFKRLFHCFSKKSSLKDLHISNYDYGILAEILKKYIKILLNHFEKTIPRTVFCESDELREYSLDSSINNGETFYKYNHIFRDIKRHALSYQKQREIAKKYMKEYLQGNIDDTAFSIEKKYYFDTEKTGYFNDCGWNYNWDFSGCETIEDEEERTKFYDILYREIMFSILGNLDCYSRLPDNSKEIIEIRVKKKIEEFITMNMSTLNKDEIELLKSYLTKTLDNKFMNEIIQINPALAKYIRADYDFYEKPEIIKLYCRLKRHL